MSIKLETTDSITADMTANHTRTPLWRGRRLTATAAATLACALAAGCLAIDDPEALEESDEIVDIDSDLLVDGIAVAGASDPADPEDIAAAPGRADPGDEGKASEPRPGAGELPVTSSLAWFPRWSQGEAPVDLGGINEVYCFLTEVQGRFEGGGEAVHVYQEAGRWKLGGRSAQHGVAARALCIPLNYRGQTLTYSDEYSWDLGNYPRNMGTSANRVCLLTYVSGEFDGGGERVEAFIDVDGNWKLTGSGGRPGIAARARCVSTSFRSGPYYWHQSQATTNIIPADRWVCGLTRMTGAFEGAGERVSVQAAEYWWQLAGSSLQRDVASSAYCL